MSGNLNLAGRGNAGFRGGFDINQLGNLTTATGGLMARLRGVVDLSQHHPCRRSLEHSPLEIRSSQVGMWEAPLRKSRLTWAPDHSPPRGAMIARVFNSLAMARSDAPSSRLILSAILK